MDVERICVYTWSYIVLVLTSSCTVELVGVLGARVS